jgi:hypothetical protein
MAHATKSSWHTVKTLTELESSVNPKFGGYKMESLIKLLALVRGWNHQCLTIFSDGSARDIDIVLRQKRSNFAVRQRLAGIFLGNELLNFRSDRSG